MRFSRLWVLSWLLTAIHLMPLSVEAQSTVDGDSLPAGIFDAIQVNLVNVEVFVTDKKGDPVTGLSRDDFEIYEDGKPVAITNFYAVEGGESKTQASVASQAPVPSPKPTVAPGIEEKAPGPTDQRLHLVIYIDNFNIRPFNRNRVFRHLRSFLDQQLDSEDRVMLVSYDRSLNVRRLFTSDPQLIARALSELETLSGHGVHADSDRFDLIRAVEEAKELGEVEWRVRQYAQSLYNDLSFSIDAVREILETLGGLPGRKAFLYVSDGLPMQPAEDLYYALHQKFQDTTLLTASREQNATRRFQELGSRASSNRVTFYAIDAGGLRPPLSSSIDQQTSKLPGLYNLIDSVHVSNIQQPLLLMADYTGGKVIYNTNNFGPGLKRIGSDFGTYYSLGYTPAHSGTGRWYAIKVKAKRKGLRVRHRAGYRDKPVKSRMEDGMRSNLMYGLTQNPLNVRLRVGDSQRMDEGEYDVPIAVWIPLDQIVLVPRDEAHEGRVDLFFGALDDQGDFSSVHEFKLPIRIPKGEMEAAKKAGWIHKDRLRMRSGGHRLAVGVWDALGATASFVSKSFVVGGP